MAYNTTWGENHRGYLVYLVDLSLSMGESMSMGEETKIEDVIDTITQVSDYLIGMCEDTIKVKDPTTGYDKDITIKKDRFDITILGYNNDITLLFDGTVLELDKLLDEKYEANAPLFDKGEDAKPKDLTYTAKGFRTVIKYIQRWINKQPQDKNRIPAPIVIHLTDGFPMEYERSNLEARLDALNAAKELKDISVPDGNVLLFNIHIGKGENDTLIFPSTRPVDADRQFLFDASSELTDVFVRRAQNRGFCAQQNSRFMVSNQTEKNTLAQLIAFGSSVSMK